MKFMNGIDLEKSTLVFKTGEVAVSEHSECGCAGEENVCSCSTVAVTEEASVADVEPNQALVESFSDAPSLNLIVSETDENIFFVKDFDAMKDACGTGSITLEDRVAYMNMCEMNNSATVTLDIVTEGKKLKGVPFTLVKTEGKSYLQMCKAQLL